MLKAENALKSLHLEEIEDGYDWSTIDGLCDFLDDSMCEDYPKIKNFTNMLRTNQELRRTYEKLLRPCVQATDFSNKQDVDHIKQIQSEWGNATEFTFFWKQFAELSFAFLCVVSFQNNKICLTEKERGAISAIVYNDDKAISSSRLLAIHRLARGWINEAYRTEQQQKCVPVLADRDFNNVRLIGSPYFEAAKKEGLIEDNGNNLEWKGTKVLLAYFCGRIYCGDYTKSPQLVREMPIWVSGGHKLPEAELNKLFDVKDLSQQRRNRTSNEETPPKGYIEIDAIVEAVKKTLK